MSSTTQLQVLAASQASPEVPLNEIAETLSAAGIFGKNHPACTGLTFGVLGGRYNGNTVANQTVTLTNTTDNYIVVLRSTGVVSTSTTTTNWDSALYARLYKATTAGGLVTALVDHRQDTNGFMFAPPSTVGRHMVPVMAGAMQPSVSGGCQALASVATSAGQPDYAVLWFDKDSVEAAQFAIPMPSSWNRGTITFAPIWLHPAATTFGVVWRLRAVAVSNDDTVAVGFGTAQTSTDTGGTAIDLYKGPQSAAITIAGTPSSGDVVFFELARVATDGSDTLDVDAGLIGIEVYITTEAAVDA